MRAFKQILNVETKRQILPIIFRAGSIEYSDPGGNVVSGAEWKRELNPEQNIVVQSDSSLDISEFLLSLFCVLYFFSESNV